MRFLVSTLLIWGVLSWSTAGTYYIPEVQSDATHETYIGITNPNNESATLSIQGFGADGTDYGTSESLTSLPQMGMAYIELNDLFGSNAELIAWVQVTSSKTLDVFAELHSEGTRSAYWSSSQLADRLIMPHVAKNTETFSTFFSCVNASDSGQTTGLFPKPSGSPVILSEHDTKKTQVSENILNRFEDVSSIDWVSIESNSAGTTAMEYFQYNNKPAVASLGLTGESGPRLRFLHVATDTEHFWTGMVYINISDSNAQVTETYYDASGSILKTYTPAELQPGEKVTLLFDADTFDRVPKGTSWVEVVSNQDLSGYELFGSANGIMDQTFAGIQGNFASGNVLRYPYYKGSDTEWSGFVAVNVGSQPSDLTLTLYNAAGQELGQFTQTGIAPNSKFVALGDSMFPGQTEGAWVEAKASSSEFAGFLLWGDHNGDFRDHLSGLNAQHSVVSAEGIPERSFIPVPAGNTSYETAMELTPDPLGWNVNAIGNIDQNTAGTIVNDYGSGQDDMESVFKFTLTEPTKLVIAVRAAAGSFADLDFYVVNNQRPNGNFFEDLSVSEHFDPTIDYAAAGGGDESVARVYQPGTYYILVSIFEDNANLQNTDFGLLVTEFPVYLNCFEDVTDFENQTQEYFIDDPPTDTDQTASWESFPWNETKYGTALSQLPANGGREASGVQSKYFSIPDSGLTIMDFDSALLADGPVSQNEPSFSLFLVEEFSSSLNFIGGISYAAGYTFDLMTVNGIDLNVSPWVRWIVLTQTLGGTINEYMIPGGSRFAMVLYGENTNERWLFDNIRVYNCAVSLDAQKRREEAPRITQAPHGRDKFSSFHLVSTHKQ